MSNPRSLPTEIAPAANQAIATEEELPVVARLVIEVRSDGKRTIARGGMEDVATGNKASVEAIGNSPLELALALAKSMLKVPALAKQVMPKPWRKLLP